MSEQAAEAGPEVVELPPMGDAAFSSLMDALAPEPEGEAGAEAAAASEPGAGAPAAGAAAAAPAADGADGATGAAASPAAGAEGAAAGAPEQPAAVGGEADRPAAWTATAAELTPKFGEISTAIEQKHAAAYQGAALEEVRTEHKNYFEALEKHPRLLVGTQVPAIGREGMETIRDASDAREWQEAVKSILVAEVRDRSARAMEENKDFLNTVHASIELFQNNADLVPGTKDFDVELANRFAGLATPYELRVDGKLQGYSIPVQPIIDQLRAQVASERAAKAATPPAAAAAKAGAAPSTPAAPADRPQGGIASKAGNSSEAEDFSALFGTLGLPNLQI